MTNLQKLQKIIQEVVPAIMELKEGCEVKYVDDIGCEIGTITWIRNKGMTQKNRCKMTLSSIGDVFTDDEEITILGRPITLEDVMITLEKENQPAFIDFCEDIWRTNLKESKQIGAYQDLPSWQLGKTLNEQEQKTIDFLLEVLTK